MFYHRFGLFFALFLGIKQGLCELKTLFLCSESFSFMSMTVTDIYEMMNSKAGAFFEWLQTHPKYGATDKPCGEGVRTLTQNCC